MGKKAPRTDPELHRLSEQHFLARDHQDGKRYRLPLCTDRLVQRQRFILNSNCTTMKRTCIFILSAILLGTGCKKYLTVQPESSYTELQVYSNERAVQQALNGLYNDLADNR